MAIAGDDTRQANLRLVRPLGRETYVRDDATNATAGWVGGAKWQSDVQEAVINRDWGRDTSLS